MAFQIQKGVPIPEAMRRGPGQSDYPFRTMEVGDSFFVPAKKSKNAEGQVVIETVRPPIPTSKKSDRKFVSRVEKDKNGNVLGVRVWRVAKETVVDQSADNTDENAATEETGGDESDI
jgi:hypothetical protein